MNKKKLHYWFLTINNPNIYENWLVHDIAAGKIDWFDTFICGREGDWDTDGTLPPTKTPHYQICFSSEKLSSFELVKSLFKRAHIERCKNFKKSIKYCSKTGKVMSFRVEAAVDDVWESSSTPSDLEPPIDTRPPFPPRDSWLFEDILDDQDLFPGAPD